MKWFGKKQQPESVDDADQMVIGQLVQHGAQLNKAREVQHFLYFETESDAQAANEAISSVTPWISTVQDPQGDIVQWAVIAELPAVVVSIGSVRKWRQQFEAIAAEHHGDYDGWVASVEAG